MSMDLVRRGAGLSSSPRPIIGYDRSHRQRTFGFDYLVNVRASCGSTFGGMAVHLTAPSLLRLVMLAA